MKIENKCWYSDYIRTTDDTTFILKHFIRDYIFQHRLRYMIYFRKCQNTQFKPAKYYYEYKLLRLCRKYGIEIKTQTQIGKGFVMVHPYNITISPHSKIGKNVNIAKGATIGLSKGKRQGAPQIGNCVQIGINSTVVGGITVGDDVLIAPNTFVNQDIPEHSVVIGNPCKIIHKEDATKDYIIYRV